MSPFARARDRIVGESLAAAGRRLHLERGLLVVEPEDLSTDDGRPVTVFTPFSRRWSAVPSGRSSRPPAPSRHSPPERSRARVSQCRRRPLLTSGCCRDPARRRRASAWPGGSRRQPCPAYADGRNRLDVEGTSRLSADLKFGSALAAGGVAGSRRAGRRASRLRVRALLARVLLARAVALPARGPGRVPARLRRRPVDRRPGRPGGLASGPHRLPGRGRRDAPARSKRLDAQSGPDDRGELPRQGPPDRLAARRSPLHGPPRRRRRGRQQRRLAVDRGDGDGRRTVLPGLQSGGPGSPLRSRRRLRPALGAGAVKRPGRVHPRALDDARSRAGCCRRASSGTTTQPRWSTTPRLGCGPSPPTVSPGRARGSCRGPGTPSARRAGGRRPTSAGRRGGARGPSRPRPGRPSPRVPLRGCASGGGCRR